MKTLYSSLVVATPEAHAHEAAQALAHVHPVPPDFVLRLLEGNNNAVRDAAVDAFSRLEPTEREAQAERVVRLLEHGDRDVRMSALT